MVEKSSLDVVKSLSKVSLGQPVWQKVVKKMKNKVERPSESVPRALSALNANSLKYEPFEVSGQPPVPKLANKLDRVLFNSGVTFLKDPRTNVYNFDPRLEKIMSIADFDFSKVPPYVPAGRDSQLAKLAKEANFRYVGSTSSLTGVLIQLHHALSHMRPPQILNTSKYFGGRKTSFTATQRAPVAFTLRKSDFENVYAVSQPSGKSSELILTLLGHAMEIMLTTGCTEFQGYSKGSGVAVDEPQGSTYNYTSCGPFLMRSQLDCYDPRLPGTGMFDLKTRACCAIRHDVDYAQIKDGSDYQIVKLRGQYESFEREYYELVRSALFKYSLQARIGRMDGIFVAYHNVRRLFGFEYLPLTEIDKVFHTVQLLFENELEEKEANGPETEEIGLPETDLRQYDLEQRLDIATNIADSEFKLSMHLLGDILDHLRENVLSPDCPDLNCVIHSGFPGKVLVMAAPGTEGSLLSGETPPPGFKAFVVSLEQTVDGKVVERTKYPSPQSPQEDWCVSATVTELDITKALEAFKRAKAQQVQQFLTSEPQTEEQPTQEIISEMLKKLPKASELQTILRAFERKGLEYTKWDSERPKTTL